MEAEAIDIQQKRQELLQLFDDVFDICKGLVASAKAGDMALKASMLKEINQFMRQSAALLDRTEKLQKKREEAEQEVSEQEQQEQQELDAFAQHEAEWERADSGPDPKELQGAPLDY